MKEDGFILSNVKEKIDYHLTEIGKMFKTPQITLVVRAPQLNDGDLIMTNDNLSNVIIAIEKLKERYEKD